MYPGEIHGNRNQLFFLLNALIQIDTHFFKDIDIQKADVTVLLKQRDKIRREYHFSLGMYPPEQSESAFCCLQAVRTLSWAIVTSSAGSSTR